MSNIIIPNPPKIVIVRAQLAGLHCGELIRTQGDGSTYVLNRATRLWRWRGANTVTELALRGASMKSYTRISERSPGEVTIHDAFECIECAADAGANLLTPRWLP